LSACSCVTRAFSRRTSRSMASRRQRGNSVLTKGLPGMEKTPKRSIFLIAPRT
jgi:hypothetical protein